MIEAVGIPVLLKAVDLFFEEGKKILQERRERWKAKNDVDIAKPEIASKSSSVDANISDVITSKEIAMS